MSGPLQSKYGIKIGTDYPLLIKCDRYTRVDKRYPLEREIGAAVKKFAYSFVENKTSIYENKILNEIKSDHTESDPSLEKQDSEGSEKN